MSTCVYTVDEAADIMRCSVGSVYRLIRDKRLRSFDVGKRGKRITAAALEAYMTGANPSSDAPSERPNLRSLAGGAALTTHLHRKVT